MRQSGHNGSSGEAGAFPEDGEWDTLADALVSLMDRHAPAAGAFHAEAMGLLASEPWPAPDREALVARLALIARLTPRPATRRSFVKAYLRIHAFGIHTDGRDSSVIVELTTRCNRRCAHCYASPVQSGDLPSQTLGDIVAYVRRHAKHICITGGEPFLDDRLLPVAEANPDILFFVFTNGTLLGSALARRIAETPNLVPLLSLDGSTAARHDALKGAGSFDQVSRAIDAMQAAGAPWGYSAVVNTRTAEDVLSPDFVRTCRSRGAIVGKYVEYIPLGWTADRALIPTGEVYALMERRKKEIAARGEIYIQDTEQSRCHGLLFFDVRGNVKACPFFHYARYAVGDAPLPELARRTEDDWLSFAHDGECPLYADAMGLKRHLAGLGWRPLSDRPDYLADPDLCALMSRRYHDFLRLRAAEHPNGRP